MMIFCIDGSIDGSAVLQQYEYCMGSGTVLPNDGMIE